MSNSSNAKNVYGEPLQACCFNPRTGFYRDGHCHTGAEDRGLHIICVQVTDEFLEFSASRGNDLITPMPAYSFPGLKDGDCWCLCILRWKEALEAGVAPKVKLSATHISALEYVNLAQLEAMALEEDVL